MLSTLPTKTSYEVQLNASLAQKRPRYSVDSIETVSSRSSQHEGSQGSTSSWSESESESVDKKLPSTWEDKNEKTVREPYNYVVSLPGKEIRRQILQAFNVWFEVDKHCGEIIANAVTMLHNGSLLIDDIQDGSKLRRGSPTAHEVYGVAQTINSGNYVYFQAQHELLALQNWPQACTIYIEEMLNLHRGQGMELHWRDTFQPPTEAEYLQMISNKTGGLFRLIARLLQCVSTRTLDVGPLVDVIGLMFQILDDYKSMREDKMKAQKGYCEDLTEGKFSYPICHAIWTDSPHKQEILDILSQKTEDDDLKACAVQLLEESGSFDYTRHVLEDLDRRARVLLGEIKVANPAVEALLDKLMDSLRACR